MPSPKPVAVIRRTPRPEDVESFIRRAHEPSDAQTSEHPDVQETEHSDAPPTQRQHSSLKGPGMVKRRDGRVRRRMTIYLPPDLAQELNLHCVTQGTDLSETVTRAIAKLLKSR